MVVMVLVMELLLAVGRLLVLGDAGAVLVLRCCGCAAAGAMLLLVLGLC